MATELSVNELVDRLAELHGTLVQAVGLLSFELEDQSLWHCPVAEQRPTPESGPVSKGCKARGLQRSISELCDRSPRICFFVLPRLQRHPERRPPEISGADRVGFARLCLDRFGCGSPLLVSLRERQEVCRDYHWSGTLIRFPQCSV